MSNSDIFSYYLQENKLNVLIFLDWKPGFRDWNACLHSKRLCECVYTYDNVDNDWYFNGDYPYLIALYKYLIIRPLAFYFEPSIKDFQFFSQKPWKYRMSWWVLFLLLFLYPCGSILRYIIRIVRVSVNMTLQRFIVFSSVLRRMLKITGAKKYYSNLIPYRSS